MSVISAVNSPSFGAQPLSGVKRGRIGPPTSVPTNLPSFRGANNAPGQPIRAPLLVNGNRHDRGTNATIPYSRKVDRSNYLGDIAELGLGDVAFVRRGAPDFELGYGVNSIGRLISLIRLNEELRDHDAKMADGTYANIVFVDDYKNMDKANISVLERCPTLKEWWLDGVVLSTDEPECYHVGLPTQGFNQVYNIAVAGHAAVNNGFSPVIDKDNGPARSLRNAPRIHTAKGEGAAGMISSSRNGRMVMNPGPGASEVMQYEQVHYVHAQTFTRKPQMLETFYLALIRTENPPIGTMSGNYYSFQYLEVTSSQLNAAGSGFRWLEDSTFGSVEILKTLFGLDGGGKHRLVGLFKLGRVCDTKAAIPPGWNGAPPDRGYRVTLSINIEWFETRDVINRRLGWPSLQPPPSGAPPRSGTPPLPRRPFKRQNTSASASGPPPDLIAAAPTSTSAAPPAAAAPTAPSAPAAPTSTSATSAVPSMLPPAPPKPAASAPPKRAATPKRTAATPIAPAAAAAPAAPDAPAAATAPAAAVADKPELSSVARRARAAAEAISPAGALSSIFGGAAAGSLEPLQAAHRERSVLDREKPGAKSSDADGSTGRSFVRRGRSEK